MGNLCNHCGISSSQYDRIQTACQTGEKTARVQQTCNVGNNDWLYHRSLVGLELYKHGFECLINNPKDFLQHPGKKFAKVKNPPDSSLPPSSLLNGETSPWCSSANVKLIGFGLSATDSTLSLVDNDPRADILSLGRLMPSLLPERRSLASRCRDGRFANIAALRQELTRRKRARQLLPVVLSVVMLAVASVLFYFSLSNNNSEQQRYENMVAVVDEHIVNEREQLVELVNRPCSFDATDETEQNAFIAYLLNEYSALRYHRWTIRDSLVETYPENDPLREQCFQYWTHKEVELDKEFYPQLIDKLKY